ncbi:MAG: pitrilysin family protein [Candidatus Solibacter sp.]
MRGLRLCSLLISAVVILSAQELQELQKKIAEFTLPNGLHFLVLERHDSPVISFHTWIDAGSVNDPAGQSGVAHMLEHMAFKGSETLGTRNWPEEKKALDAVEDALSKAEAEARKGARADQVRIDGLRNLARQALEAAQRLSASAEYRRFLDENGAVNLQTEATATYTENSYSLPSNRAELWFLMESQRLIRPAFREFYNERTAVLEEYRQRVEGNPQAKMLAELLAAAFKTHPYRNPVIGWPSDMQLLRRSQAQEFFEQYYVPGNITMAMVGDITLTNARWLAERYFGSMPAKPLPPRVSTQEPPQIGPKTVVVELPGPTVAMVGYKRPSQYDKDDVALDVLQIILSQGRLSMLYTDLVQEKRLAQQAQATSTIPDGRFPSLFLFTIVPAPGRTVEENQKALDDMLARFKTTPVDPQLLARAKAAGRANLIRRLNSNPDTASLLALHAGSFGDWRRLFTQLDDLNKVRAEDLQRVASRYFVATGRTTLYSVQPGQSNAPPVKVPERKTGGAQ